MKTILVILGPGASGKSTLTRVLCGAAAKEYVHPVLREKYAVGNGFAVPGTLKNGSDSISVMATRAALVLQLLARPDVGYVILDGVRSSYRWDVAWVRTQPVAALYVYFDISLEENQRRLLARRRANGKQEATLPPKTYQNMLAFRARAKSVFTAAQRQIP